MSAKNYNYTTNTTYVEKNVSLENNKHNAEKLEPQAWETGNNSKPHWEYVKIYISQTCEKCMYLNTDVAHKYLPFIYCYVRIRVDIKDLK